MKISVGRFFGKDKIKRRIFGFVSIVVINELQRKHSGQCNAARKHAFDV